MTSPAHAHAPILATRDLCIGYRHGLPVREHIEVDLTPGTPYLSGGTQRSREIHAAAHPLRFSTAEGRPSRAPRTPSAGVFPTATLPHPGRSADRNPGRNTLPDRPANGRNGTLPLLRLLRPPGRAGPGKKSNKRCGRSGSPRWPSGPWRASATDSGRK